MIGGIYLLLYIALNAIRTLLLAMVNPLLALIGGVVMLFLSGGTLLVASLIGFIMLFGSTICVTASCSSAITST